MERADLISFLQTSSPFLSTYLPGTTRFCKDIGALRSSVYYAAWTQVFPEITMKLVVDGHARLADAHTSPCWLGRSRSRGLGLVDVHGPIVKPIDRFASFFIGPSAAVRVLFDLVLV